jgi:hypothetical protein
MRFLMMAPPLWMLGTPAAIRLAIRLALISPTGAVRLAVLLVGSAASCGAPAILWLESVHERANTVDQAKIFFRRSLLVTGGAHPDGSADPPGTGHRRRSVDPSRHAYEAPAATVTIRLGRIMRPVGNAISCSHRGGQEFRIPSASRWFRTHGMTPTSMRDCSLADILGDSAWTAITASIPRDSGCVTRTPADPNDCNPSRKPA